MNKEGASGRKGLVVGLIVLALIAGVYLVVGKTGGTAATGEVFVIPYDESVDLTKADRDLDAGGVKVNVGMSRPARPLEPITFRIRFEDASGSFLPSGGELAFNMKMDMGRYVATLSPEGGALAGAIAVPTCMSGGRRWYARLRFEHAGAPREATFLFDLE